MRHKHADLIIEWAETGCQMEFRTQGKSVWVDVSGTPVWNENIEYRKKKQTIFYRKYLAKDIDGKYYVSISNKGNVTANPELLELQQSGHFIKWIDTKWQEVEI